MTRICFRILLFLTTMLLPKIEKILPHHSSFIESNVAYNALAIYCIAEVMVGVSKNKMYISHTTMPLPIKKQNVIIKPLEKLVMSHTPAQYSLREAIVAIRKHFCKKTESNPLIQGFCERVLAFMVQLHFHDTQKKEMIRLLLQQKGVEESTKQIIQLYDDHKAIFVAMDTCDSIAMQSHAAFRLLALLNFLEIYKEEPKVQIAYNDPQKVHILQKIVLNDLQQGCTYTEKEVHTISVALQQILKLRRDKDIGVTPSDLLTNVLVNTISSLLLHREMNIFKIE